MIIESIILAIFVVSLGGALIIVARKIPVLNTFPQNGTTGIRKHHIISDVENRIKEILVYFEKQRKLKQELTVLYTAFAKKRRKKTKN
jgi:hypothetical protein